MTNSFIHILFIGLIALFPVINPIGSAFIVNPYFVNLSRQQKRNAVKRISLYAFAICAVTLFIGNYILQLFGLSIPVIQLAGGIMICKMGWQFLSREEHLQNVHNKIEEIGKDHEDIENKLFYPITFPVTTGAGTISVLFTLSAHSHGVDIAHYLLNESAIFLAVIIMCILIYMFYMNTKTLLDYIGKKGEIIINQISAFLIFCVGLQIAVVGLTTLLKA